MAMAPTKSTCICPTAASQIDRDDEIRPGDRLHHYRILTPLGEGGMGQVFLAEDLRQTTRVALKVLRPDVCSNPELRARLAHEATMAGALTHPNIVSIREVGNHGGCLFVAMEYIDGPTVEELLASGPLPLDRTFDIIRQIGKGLQTAHRAGIVHRDLKPSNILLTKEGRAKLTDFGLATSNGSVDTDGGNLMLGTIPYMSPEQIMGRPADSRSDLFSLGVVLYQMITGVLPFTSEYLEVIPYAILNDVPEPLSHHRAGVPQRLEKIVARLLQKDPRDRFSDVSSLLRALGRLERTAHAPRTVRISSPGTARASSSPFGGIDFLRRRALDE